LAGKKPDRWAWLRGKYPALPEEPEHADVVHAAKQVYSGRTLEQLAAALNTLEAIKEIQEKYVSSTNADIKAVEQLMDDAFREQQIEGIKVGGYAFAPKTEPSVKVTDPAEYRAYIEEHMPELLTVYAATTQAMFLRALEAGEPTPPGLEITGVRTSISRRKS
jgi:hypothetical protein